MMDWDDDLDLDSSDTPKDDTPKVADDVEDDWDAEEEKPEEKQPEKPKEKEADDWVESSDDEPAPAKEEKKQEKPVEEPIPEPIFNEKEPTFRSPICVIMGHVDTGKTSLLDKIRRTNVQGGEVGGITQQIGASYFPTETLQKQTRSFVKKYGLEYKIPGLLIIDTPGHESFTNLRSRGSSLCDCAILVVDILGGLEQQTLESIQLLRARKTPFVIALNKIDTVTRDYKAPEKQYATFEETFKSQTEFYKRTFLSRLEEVMTAFAKERLNTQIYTKLKFGPKEQLTAIPIIPTCARNGEGIPDLLLCLQLMTQYKMADRITLKKELQCNVLEVKKEEGIGITLDVILVNGYLRVNDQIVVSALGHKIITTKIRALLTPQPLRELRVKSQWVHHDIVYAAMGLKISAPDLEDVIPGSPLYVAHNEEEVELYSAKLMEQNESELKFDKDCNGVMVKASTIGALEALVGFLQTPTRDKKPGDIDIIDVSVADIGPVHRADVQRIQPMLEKSKKHAVILAFNVPITPEAKTYAKSVGIQIFQAEIIYHLRDQYTAYVHQLELEAKEAARSQIVFPVKLQYLPNATFNRTKPMIIGVKVLQGRLHVNTPICVLPSTPKEKAPKPFGIISSIKLNDGDITVAPTGAEVSVNIQPVMKKGVPHIPVSGKDASPGDILVSKTSRKIIDLLKEHFKNDDNMRPEEWSLLRDLKKPFKIE